MPSAALLRWQNDRMTRLSEVDAHCASVLASVPPNPTFLDETLRGFVLHGTDHRIGSNFDQASGSAPSSGSKRIFEVVYFAVLFRGRLESGE
jgi:hypothetical protein